MKKILILLVLVSLIFTFTACSAADDNSTHPKTEESKVKSKNDLKPESHTTAEPKPTPEKIESCRLQFDIKFEENIMLATYDIDVYFDDVLLSTIPHGKYFLETIDTKVGTHIVRFTKHSDEAVSIDKEISLTGDQTITCTLHSNESDIEIKGFELLDGITSTNLEMPDVIGTDLFSAKKALEELGFVNINYVTPDNATVWDETNWTVIDQNVPSGLVVNKLIEITLKCEKPGYSFDTNDAKGEAIKENVSENSSNAIIEENSSEKASDENSSEESSKEDSSEQKPESSATNDSSSSTENDSIYDVAYKSRTTNYSLYYIIDFDSGTVRYFSTDETAVEVGHFSGADFNSWTEIYYPVNDYSESFIYKDGGDTLLIKDYHGFENYYDRVDVSEAESILTQEGYHDMGE